MIPTFEVFWETTSTDPSAVKATNGPTTGITSHVRDNRIAGTQANRVSGQTNLVSQSNINTQTATKNQKIDQIVQNPSMQADLDDNDVNEVQTNYGINVNDPNFKDNEVRQVNSKIPVGVLKTGQRNAAGKPIFRFVYSPQQQGQQGQAQPTQQAPL